MELKLTCYGIYRLLDAPICGVDKEILTLKADINDANDYVYQTKLKNPNSKIEIKKVIIDDGRIYPI